MTLPTFFTAEAETWDRPWIIAHWPGLSRERFNDFVKARLLDESIPNPDDNIQRLTLCEWDWVEGASWIDGLAPAHGFTWSTLLERASYLDLVWTYPGEWIELEVGQHPPIPAEYGRTIFDIVDADDCGYEPTDPKHPAFHDLVAGIWDNRDKTA